MDIKLDYSTCSEYYRDIGWVHAACKARSKKSIQGKKALMYKRALDKGERCRVCRCTQEQLSLVA